MNINGEVTLKGSIVTLATVRNLTVTAGTTLLFSTLNVTDFKNCSKFAVGYVSAKSGQVLMDSNAADGTNFYYNQSVTGASNVKGMTAFQDINSPQKKFYVKNTDVADGVFAVDIYGMR